MIQELLEHHILDHIVAIKLFGLDISLTQHTLFMLGISVCLLILLPLFASLKSGRLRAIMEAFVLFVQDSIVLPNIGPHGKKLVPFFCTLLVFLLFANYLGMMPEARTITSNISVTGGMAIASFLCIIGFSIKENGFGGFIKTFVPGGVPWWLVPMLFVLEIFSLIIKTFVLAIRLFANMTAGHIILLCLFSFIFILAQKGAVFGYSSGVPVLGMTLFISILELLVAAIQAYVFTLLTAIFVGLQSHSH